MWCWRFFSLSFKWRRGISKYELPISLQSIYGLLLWRFERIIQMFIQYLFSIFTVMSLIESITVLALIKQSRAMVSMEMGMEVRTKIYTSIHINYIFLIAIWCFLESQRLHPYTFRSKFETNVFAGETNRKSSEWIRKDAIVWKEKNNEKTCYESKSIGIHGVIMKSLSGWSLLSDFFSSHFHILSSLLCARSFTGRRERLCRFMNDKGSFPSLIRSISH